MNQRDAGRSHREAELTFSESHIVCGSESRLVHKFHMQCLRWRWSLFQVICPLSSAGVLDNASLYRLPSRLQVITCVLVGDNWGIGFLVRRIAPWVRKMGEEMNGDPQGCSRADALLLQ